MLDRLNYRYNLTRLQIRKSLITIVYVYFRHKADKSKKWPKYEEARSKYNQRLRIVRDEISYLVSEHLLFQAIKYRLPFPSEEFNDDQYENLDTTRRSVLSYDAERELRSAIRVERKERSELARSWLTGIAVIIGAVTGLIGALIGLLTLLWRHQTG